MKKLLLILSIGACMLGMSSCDTRPNVIGEWQGNIKGEMPGTATSNLTATYAFNRDGSVTASYLVNFTEAAAPNDSLISPYQISVSGTAMVNGKWQYVEGEDDEIAIVYDMTTLKVQIDPEAVKMQANVITDQQVPKLDDMMPALVSKYTHMVENYFKQTPTVVWDDVKVKKPILRYEIGHDNYLLQQVAAAADE